ncbi:MAG TPA: hypothetical protein VHI54_07600 [Actinomycetota bacterium]|nr:hypothetical protein [Actinomycetota bacterium]
MNSLRRTLYLGAAAFVLTGLFLAIAPRFLLVVVLQQLELPDYVGPRLAGVGAVVAAMLMVLMGHRIEEVWWWSWAFVIGAAGFAIVSLLRALFGPSGASALPWWLLAAASAAFGASLVWGLFVAAQERPPS